MSFFKNEEFCTRFLKRVTNRLYNNVDIIHLVYIILIFTDSFLPCFPLLLDLLAHRVPLWWLNIYSHGCYSEHNLLCPLAGFYCFFYSFGRKKLMCEGKFFPCILYFLSLHRTINIAPLVLKKSHGSKWGISHIDVKPLCFTRMLICPYFLYALLFPAHFIQFDATS